MKKKRRAVFAAIICGMILFLHPAAAKGTEECYQALLEKGFPEDYAASLAPLARAHPSWHFEALFVTEISRAEGAAYDFAFCLEHETELPRRSLVPAGAKSLAAGDAAFDSGLAPASREAVAFFLDPRNFLCEEGIFQFWDLSGGGGDENDAAALFRGSVLEEIRIGGKSLAAFLCEEGEKAGVNAVFLADRLRQEQGKSGNALITGTGGDTLCRWKKEGTDYENGKRVLTPKEAPEEAELTALNGYYNFFNIGANGNGAFEITRRGLARACREGWDSPEKAVAGGIAYLKEEYLARYQNTLYLQKWNVDARSKTAEGFSRNFWGQYMQNILAPSLEGKRLGAALAQTDGAFSFLIPVYENMPASPSPDPSGGEYTFQREIFAPGKENESAPEKSAPEKSASSPEKAAFPLALGLGAAFFSALFLCFFSLALSRSALLKK